MDTPSMIRLLKDAVEPERIRLESLVPVARKDRVSGDSRAYYCCPCGEQNHYGSIAMDFSTGLSTTSSYFIHCYEYGRKWLVVTDAAVIILSEEIRFADLLDRHADLVGKKVDAETAFRYHSELGIPVELLDCSDLPRFDRLMDAHRDASGRRRKKGGV